MYIFDDSCNDPELKQLMPFLCFDPTATKQQHTLCMWPFDCTVQDRPPSSSCTHIYICKYIYTFLQQPYLLQVQFLSSAIAGQVHQAFFVRLPCCSNHWQGRRAVQVRQVLRAPIQHNLRKTLQNRQVRFFKQNTKNRSSSLTYLAGLQLGE